MIWTQEENEILKNNYSTTKTSELCKLLPNKTRVQITSRACRFKLKKQIGYGKNTLDFLLNLDNPETCYWLGFITADGCFLKNKNQISIGLGIKDKNHLIKFAQKCNSNVLEIESNCHFTNKKSKIAYTIVSDRFIIPKLIKVLNFTKAKTYYPINISCFMTKERLLYFLCGFIDGDGYIGINKNNSISINLHENWINNLKLIKNNLENLFNIKSQVNLYYNRYHKKKFARFVISRKNDIIDIFDQIKNKIPFLERKWHKISLLTKKQLKYRNIILVNDKTKSEIRIDFLNEEWCVQNNFNYNGLMKFMREEKTTYRGYRKIIINNLS